MPDLGNVAGPAGNLLRLDVPDRQNLRDEIRGAFDYYDEEENLVEIADGFSIWFVAFYADVSLDATSEFGTMPPMLFRHTESATVR